MYLPTSNVDVDQTEAPSTIKQDWKVKLERPLKEMIT